MKFSKFPNSIRTLRSHALIASYMGLIALVFGPEQMFAQPKIINGDPIAELKAQTEIAPKVKPTDPADKVMNEFETWTGVAVNGTVQSQTRLEMTRHNDGTITGRWGSIGSIVAIEQGEQVTGDVIRWESTSGDHRWVVVGKFNGDSLVLEYTCTTRRSGRVEGGVGTAVLSRSNASDKANKPNDQVPSAGAKCPTSS